MGRKNIMNISTARIVSYNKHHNKTYSGNTMSQRLVDAKWQNDIVEEEEDGDDGEDEDDEDGEEDNFSPAESEKLKKPFRGIFFWWLSLLTVRTWLLNNAHKCLLTSGCIMCIQCPS